MKIEHILIFGTIVLLAIVTAISAHITVVAEKDAEIAEIQRIADESQNRLQGTITALREELQPKSYNLPIQSMSVSSRMGYRTNPMGGTEERLHKGVDLVAEVGTPVEAIADGVCAEHWPAPNGYWSGHPVMGGYIVLYHPRDGFYSLYGHLDRTFIHTGDRVARGEIIGTVGNTGISTGNHLHFEIVVDPLLWLEE